MLALMHTFLTYNQQLDAFLAPGTKARIIVTVECPAEFDNSANWVYQLYNSTPDGAGSWTTTEDPVSFGATHPDTSAPTVVISDIDLLYPTNQFSVYWHGSPETDPAPEEYVIRAWVLYG